MRNNRKHQPSKVDKGAGMSDSDSDFEADTVLVRKPRKAMACVSESNTCIRNKDSGHDTVTVVQGMKGHSDTHVKKDEPRPAEWDNLHPALQTVLPAEEGLTYVITEFTTEDFHGAPESSFQATV